MLIAHDTKLVANVLFNCLSLLVFFVICFALVCYAFSRKMREYNFASLAKFVELDV